MATEKFGFMLIFWNMAGVPYTYAHATLYLVNHPPSSYRWPVAYNITIYALLLASYYFWDTTNCQKNMFRQQMNGTTVARKTFPQLPYQAVKNPKYIKTKAGTPLLTDGWCTLSLTSSLIIDVYARKLHYTADIIMALCWAFVCGFSSPLPYWYPIWITIVVVHRAIRDVERCRGKYGDVSPILNKSNRRTGKNMNEDVHTCSYLYLP
jgi:Delta24(24(1))-sterol reductase